MFICSYRKAMPRKFRLLEELNKEENGLNDQNISYGLDQSIFVLFDLYLNIFRG